MHWLISVIHAKQYWQMNKLLMKDAGDAEAQSHDVEFVEALKYGMPPTCGFGVSERLFAFLEGKPIRDTVIFPLMKPKQKEKEEHGVNTAFLLVILMILTVVVSNGLSLAKKLIFVL